jgi:hypothetical protein
MADQRLQVIGAAPAGPAFDAVVRSLDRGFTIFTAFDDALLNRAKEAVDPESEAEFEGAYGLVGRFLTMTGEPLKALAKPLQQRALVSAICRQLQDDSPFEAVRDWPGFHKLAAEKLSELRSHGLDGDEMRSLAESASPRLSSILNELAHIEHKMREILEEMGREFSSDRIARCLTKSLAHQSAIGRIVALAGSQEHPMMEQWLAWASQQGIDVTVVVDSRPDTPRVFASSQRLADRMGRKIISLDEDKRWTDSLFADQETSEHPQITDSRSPDVLSECEWALRSCLQRINQGADPSRLCIFARSSDFYGPLLKSAALRLGVPLDVRIPLPLLSTGFARTVLGVLEAILSNDVRRVGKPAASSCFGLSSEQQTSLWTALKAACRNEKTQWSDLEDWVQERDGFEWLETALRWRKDALETEETLTIWRQKVIALAGDGGMIDLSEQDPVGRARDLAAQYSLQTSLGDAASVADRLSERRLNVHQFLRAAKEIWEEATVLVRGDEYGVKFVSKTDALPSCDLLCVLGMLEGSLPRRRSEDPLLFDSDLAELKELSSGRFALADSYVKAAAERDEFIRLCSASETALIFSYPETSDDRDNVPAFYLKELQATVSDLETLVRSRTEVVPSKEDCLSPSDLAIRESLSSDPEPFLPIRLETDAAKDAIRLDPESGVGPKEIEETIICPFRSVLQNRLKISLPRTHLLSLITDLPLQAGLPTAPDLESARTSLAHAAETRLSDLYSELEEWELKLLESASQRLTQGWLDREFAAREIWPRSDVEQQPELGGESLRAEIPTKEGTVVLKGSLPMIYKSGSFLVGRVPFGRVPETADRAIEGEPLPEPLVRFGIWLLAMKGAGAQYPALELDSSSGKRVFLYYRRPADELPNAKVQAGLSRFELSDKPNTMIRGIMDRISEAADSLKQSSIRVRPGSACERCGAGELCRRSSVFGETMNAAVQEDDS